MADISKCALPANCQKRDSCYRYTAEDTLGWQSYMVPEITGEVCQSYWPNEDSKQRKKLDKPRS